ncbi:LacI family DNA-binding transcriptional regulator [Cryptosporangium minutisporangium]|uniref:LacI family DNA-binding transcriptional regulator n=1 Tax=Cryptosporangium minutisporangium TaxID=113569 RepID=A0ABP6T0C0_9ACTN
MAGHMDAPQARTIKEIAAVAGVSKSTVSRVLNDTPGVSPKARELVLSVIARTGYQPNRAARTLVTRTTGSIGLVVSEPHGRILSDPFFASMVRGATQVVRPLGIHLVLMLAEDQHARDQLLDYLRRGHVDGVLLVSTHAADPLPRILVAERLPAVLSGRPVGRLPISYVDVDSVAGAGLAVEHLVSRGCRRIATIAGPQDMPAGQDRLRGWRKALLARGLPADRELVAYGDFDRGSGARAMEELLARGVDFDGVFVASDLMALDVLAVLREHALRVPEDVGVVGFDDSVAATQARPALTTVRQPVEEMAKALTLSLLDRIGDPDAPITSRIFPPKLIPRST